VEFNDFCLPRKRIDGAILAINKNISALVIFNEQAD